MRNNRGHFIKILVFACACIAVSALCSSISRAQANQEETVQRALQIARNGAYTGSQEKLLGRLGDASAVELTKLLADKSLDDAEIQSILLVIRQSYNFPDGIEDAANRKPRATLYLLHSLSWLAKEPKIRSSIEATTAYVKNQYAGYLQNHASQ